MPDQHECALLLGSNIGDSKAIIEEAIRLLSEKIGHVAGLSHLYETEPWGNSDQNSFYNQAVKIHTALAPEEVLNEILMIENQLGRTRNIKWEARSIDIDILYYDSLIVKQPGLEIPHHFLKDRKFTLLPLNDISPNWVHPVGGETIKELIQLCPDTLQVKRLRD